MPEFMKRYWNLYSNFLTSRSAPEAPQHHFNLTDLLRCEKLNLVGEEAGKTTFRTRKKDDSLSGVNKSYFVDLRDFIDVQTLPVYNVFGGFFFFLHSYNKTDATSKQLHCVHFIFFIAEQILACLMNIKH